MNILSFILNDPGKTVHSVAEEGLRVIKSAVVPYHRDRLFDFVTRGKLPIPEEEQRY
jgi:hypothetical protein